MLLRLLRWLLRPMLLARRVCDPGPAGARGRLLLLLSEDGPMTIDEAWLAMSQQLQTFVRSRLPCQADADDVLQDVYLKLSGRTASSGAIERIDAWLFQVARHAIADFYRRRPRSEEPVEDVADRNPASAANANGAVAAWLVELVELLPAKLRDAVRLAEIDDLPQAEVARRLGLSLSGAKS